ncbi:hypothetical protein FAVG1_08258 [Fusarium avenaceum]|nr:hypothetical protein FAVG1_08258 [Fusarium avenaceum]
MINSQRVIAALACLSIAVNAGPCKPHTTAVTSKLATSATSQLPTFESTSVVTAVTETEATTFATTTTIAEGLSSTAEASVTEGSPETSGTTTAAAATTTTAAEEESCNNQIYRGTAFKVGYSETSLDSEADCWDTCVQDTNCKSWRFEDGSLCYLYSEELADFSSPTNELDSLIGSRNCSPRDYTPCNDNIGFGYIEQEPFKGQEGVLLERECAQLCMKTAECNVWQYDSLAQKCNLFSDILETIFTPQVGAPQGSRIMLAGSRSCSSDYFKPELGPCNGQIGFHNEWLIGYRRLPQYNSVPLCARACSIDPLCQTWGVFNGNSDCSFSQEGYYEDSTDICAKGSRNCGVP